MNRESRRTYEDRLAAAITAYYRDDLGLPERQGEVSARTRRGRERGARVAAMLDREVGLDRLLVLDVGSGWGEVTFECRRRGATAWGVEPHVPSLLVGDALSRAEADAGWFVGGAGERLPFATGVFDLVICHHVIEHVHSVPAAIRELVRVARPGGRILLAFPNYLFPFEGHYRLPWIPFTPKRVGAILLRLLGRDPRFLLESINYVTYRGLIRLLRPLPVRIRSLTEEKRERAGRGAGLARRAWLVVERSLGVYPTGTLLLTKQHAVGDPSSAVPDRAAPGAKLS
ncbi:MAG: class I SAM-dependent methyltransferase [Actinobacteria bacterium]|nr:class I SAM-dependent methyltransferase [Actinomycetota bacterium]